VEVVILNIQNNMEQIKIDEKFNEISIYNTNIIKNTFDKLWYHLHEIDGKALYIMKNSTNGKTLTFWNISTNHKKLSEKDIIKEIIYEISKSWLERDEELLLWIKQSFWLDIPKKIFFSENYDGKFLGLFPYLKVWDYLTSNELKKIHSKIWNLFEQEGIYLKENFSLTLSSSWLLIEIKGEDIIGQNDNYKTKISKIVFNLVTELVEITYGGYITIQ